MGNSSASSYHGVFYDPKPATNSEGICRSCQGENVWPDGEGGAMCCDCGDRWEVEAPRQRQVGRSIALRRWRMKRGLPTEF